MIRPRRTSHARLSLLQGMLHRSCWTSTPALSTLNTPNHVPAAVQLLQLYNLSTAVLLTPETSTVLYYGWQLAQEKQLALSEPCS